MVRWGHAAWDAQALEIVRQVFQPQIYRRALIDAGTPLPGAMEKVEGSIAVPTGVGTFRGRLMLGPDRFFDGRRSEEHTSELQSLMRISYAVLCLKKKKTTQITTTQHRNT